MKQLGRKWGCKSEEGVDLEVELTAEGRADTENGQTWVVGAGDYFLKKCSHSRIPTESGQPLQEIPASDELLARSLPAAQASWMLEDILALAERIPEAVGPGFGGHDPRLAKSAATAAEEARRFQSELIESGSADLAILGALELAVVAARSIGELRPAVVTAYGHSPDPRTLQLARRNAVAHVLKERGLPRPLIAAYLVHRGLLKPGALEVLVGNRLKEVLTDRRALLYAIGSIGEAAQGRPSGAVAFPSLGLPGGVDLRFLMTLHLRRRLLRRIVDLEAARPDRPAPTGRRAREDQERVFERHVQLGSLLPMHDLLLLTGAMARRYRVGSVTAAMGRGKDTYLSLMARTALDADGRRSAVEVAADPNQASALRPMDLMLNGRRPGEAEFVQSVREMFHLPLDPVGAKVVKGEDLRPLLDRLPEEAVLAIAVLALESIELRSKGSPSATEG